MIALENTRWEDFDYTYLDELNGNPMGWLGNGYTMTDYTAGSSRTTYLDPANIDYPPVPPAPALKKGLANGDDKTKASAVHVEEIGVPTIVR